MPRPDSFMPTPSFDANFRDTHLPRRVQPQESGHQFTVCVPCVPPASDCVPARFHCVKMHSSAFSLRLSVPQCVFPASPLNWPIGSSRRNLQGLGPNGPALGHLDTGMALANVGDAGRVAGFGRGMASPLHTRQVKRCDLTEPWFPGIPRYQTRRVRAHFRIACSRRRAR